jgi:hypothetical protein
MRASPTAAILQTALTIRYGGNITSSGSSIYFSELDQNGASVAINGFSGGATSGVAILRTNNAVGFSAEL